MGDLRAAFRTISGHPWFSAAIVATLAVGIGINTTVFTLVYAVLFKPLPFPTGGRIVTIVGANKERPDVNVSYPDFLDLKTQTSSFEQVEAASTPPGVLSDADHPPERIRTARVTTGLFKMIQVNAIAGRTLQPGDEAADAPPVAVIGYAVWRDRYSLARDIVGRGIRLNEKPMTIVGVMPEGFKFPNREDIWIPYTPRDTERENRGNRFLTTFGLLKPGVSFASANTDLSVVAARIATAHSDTNKDLTARAMTFNERFNGGPIRTVFYLMIAAVGLVLLIACANVANMMLSRALGRQREMSVRSALGASRIRLIRQLLTESLLLSAAGGSLGILLTVVGVPAFDRAVANSGKPSWVIFTMDYTVLAYFVGLCVLSALLFGLAPALRSSRVDLNHVLKEGGRGGTGRMGWLSGALVVLQFTFAVVLLTGAGLMIRSFIAGQNVNSWIPRAEILSARLELPESRYPNREARRQFVDRAEARLAAIPGATGHSISTFLPALGGLRTERIEVEGDSTPPADRASLPVVAVSEGYFHLVNLPMMRGRPFDDRDGADGPEAAIVSRTFAARFWPNEDAIGKRIRIANRDTPGPWMTIVGVSGEIVQQSQTATPDAVVFVPIRQDDTTFMVIAARTAGDGTTLAGPVRAAVQALDPDLPLFDVETIETLVYNQRWPYRVFGTIFGIFAMAALLMASVGLYAVMSQATSRRTREIGIRMALGATPSRILRSVMRRGAIQLSIGLALGLGAAFAATGAMRTLLLGVLPGDPAVFGATAFILTSVGLLACWLPARRAALVPPMRALSDDDRA